MSETICNRWGVGFVNKIIVWFFKFVCVLFGLFFYKNVFLIIYWPLMENLITINFASQIFLQQGLLTIIQQEIHVSMHSCTFYFQINLLQCVFQMLELSFFLFRNLWIQRYNINLLPIIVFQLPVVCKIQIQQINFC